MNTNKSSISVISGGLAGAVEAGCTWPMENIKTKLQMESKINPRFTGIYSCARYTIQHHGLLSLYKGLPPILLTSIPKGGLRFSIFTGITNNYLTSNSSRDRFTAGLIAGMTEASIVSTPVETMKTQLIKGNHTFISGAKHIIKTEGYTGFYKGGLPTILKAGTNQGIRFALYYKYKEHIENYNNAKITKLQSLFGGMSVGLINVLTNNPIDVIRTRLQSDHSNSVIDCVKKTYKEGIIKGFYSGTVARLSRVVPGQGIIFMIYETIYSNISNIMK